MSDSLSLGLTLTISVSVPSNNEEDSSLCEHCTYTRTSLVIHLNVTSLSVYDRDGILFWTL